MSKNKRILVTRIIKINKVFITEFPYPWLPNFKVNKSP